ncbi:hypothetical protein SKA08_15495, partial [Enterococcus faecium]
MKILIVFTIIVIVVVFLFNINQEKVDEFSQENPCRKSPVTEQNLEKGHHHDPYANRYNLWGQEPLNKMYMIESWNVAKKIPTVGNVIEPLYIPAGFEL